MSSRLNLRAMARGIGSWFAFGRNMHLIVASAFAANVVGIANFQYLPLYIRQLGGSIENLAFFYTIQTVVLVVLTLLGGWLVDRFNRKLLFSLTPALAGAASLLHSLAPSWEWLLPGLCLNLLSMSIGGPIFFSMTSDIAPRDRRAAFFGYQAMAFSVCGIVGPLVGGYFFEHVGYRWFLVGGAALALTASYLRSLIRDPREDPNWVPEGSEAAVPRPAGPKRGNLAGDFWGNIVEFFRWARGTPGVLLFMLLINLPALGGKMIESYFSVYLNEVALIAPTAMGVLYAIGGSVAVPSNLIGGRVADHIGRRRMVSAAYLFSGAWLATLTLMTGYPAMVGMFALDGLIHGGMFPSIDAWNADLCPSRRRGTFMAVLRLTGVMLAIPGPVLGAWLWSAAGPTAPLQVTAAISVAAGILLFRFGPRVSDQRTRFETAGD